MIASRFGATGGAGDDETQPVPAAALIEAERVQREVLAVEHVVEQRSPEEKARHVLFGPAPVGFLRVQQELRAPGDRGPVRIARLEERHQSPRGLDDLALPVGHVAAGQATAVMLAPPSVVPLPVEQPAAGRTQRRVPGTGPGGKQAPDAEQGAVNELNAPHAAPRSVARLGPAQPGVGPGDGAGRRPVRYFGEALPARGERGETGRGALDEGMLGHRVAEHLGRVQPFQAE